MQLTDEIIQLFNSIGSLICHQKIERTLWIGGHYLPVCARDTGACIGLLLGYILLFFLRKKEAKGPPNLFVTLAMMVPLLVDSISQALGLWTSTNDIRLMTGLLFGTALAPFLVYALSMATFKKKILLLKGILVDDTVPDDKNSWFGAKSLFLGAIGSGISFLAIRSVTGSNFLLFYWMLSIPVIAIIIWHIFVLPILLLVAVIRHMHSTHGGAENQ